VDNGLEVLGLGGGISWIAVGFLTKLLFVPGRKELNETALRRGLRWMERPVAARLGTVKIGDKET
jgi:hypothetical protein